MLTPIEPVSIWEEGHIKRTLNSVEGAGRCLTLNWPGDRTAKAYIAACKACLAALRHRLVRRLSRRQRMLESWRKKDHIREMSRRHRFMERHRWHRLHRWHHHHEY
jgi:hypothetical protein